MPLSLRSRGAAKVGAAVLFLVVLTAAYTWPLPIYLAAAVPHDSGDPLLVTWILWWSTHTIPLTAAWWNAPAFYPSTGVFAFSETLLGLAPLTAPVLWLGGPPLVAYNVAFLASFVLSGLGAYLLGFVLTRQHGAALVAAVAFAFSPYRLAHLNHLQLLSSYWMPVAVAALHLYARDGNRRWAAVFAVAWLMQALSCGYYFFFLSLLAVLWLGWFARRWARRKVVYLGTAWLLAALLVAPLFWGYKRIQDAYGFKRTPPEIAYYSADIAGLASAAPESLAWRRVHAIDQPESELFPGLTIVLLCIAGLVIGKSSSGQVERMPEGATGSAFRFYLTGALVMWLLALGPAPAFQGRTLDVPGPYWILMYVPGFNGMRVPARLWMVAVLCLCAAASIAVARVRGRTLRRTLVFLGVAGLLVDGWPSTLPLAADPGMQVTHANAVARLGLPLQGNETETMYGAIAQARPVFNGYSGYTAPQHSALADLLDDRNDEILQRLSSTGPIEVIVRHDLDPDGRWRQFVATSPGARLTDDTRGWTAFEIPRSLASLAPPATGNPVRIARLDASTNPKDVNAIVDGDLDTRWHTDRQRGGETIVADLGEVRRPAAVVLSLGTYASQYPRTLEVSISRDGLDWHAAWTGGTALLTYDGAVQSPRRVPISIPLARAAARYIRLRQVGQDRRGWTIVELRILE